MKFAFTPFDEEVFKCLRGQILPSVEPHIRKAISGERTMR
jgi:hypothetical protein